MLNEADRAFINYVSLACFLLITAVSLEQFLIYSTNMPNEVYFDLLMKYC